MNAEIKNDTNNNDTVEQNQNPDALGTPEPASPAPLTDPSATSDPSDSSQPQTMITPATDSPAPSDSSDSSDLTPTTDPSNTSVPSDSIPNTQAVTVPGATNPSVPESNNPSSLFSNPPPLDPNLVPARRRGPVCKVAKLPVEIRNLVNEQLLLGTSYKHITQLLEEMGHPGFSHTNICRWAQGGFKTWAFLQVDLTLQKARREAALKQAIEKGHRLDEAALNMALTNVCDIVANLDVRKIQSQLHQHPGHFVALFNGLSRFVTRNNAFDRIKNSPGNTIKPVITRSEAIGGLTVEQRDAAAAQIGIF